MAWRQTPPGKGTAGAKARRPGITGPAHLTQRLQALHGAHHGLVLYAQLGRQFCAVQAAIGRLQPLKQHLCHRTICHDCSQSAQRVPAGAHNNRNRNRNLRRGECNVILSVADYVAGVGVPPS